jgi:uncharacterized protein with PIN domain
MPTDDVIDGLRSIGLRASKEALRALLDHATTSRLSPVQTCEELIALERRERDARNLAGRTKAATLGKVKPLRSSMCTCRGATSRASSRAGWRRYTSGACGSSVRTTRRR